MEVYVTLLMPMFLEMAQRFLENFCTRSIVCTNNTFILNSLKKNKKIISALQLSLLFQREIPEYISYASLN